MCHLHTKLKAYLSKISIKLSFEMHFYNPISHYINTENGLRKFILIKCKRGAHLRFLVQ